MTLKTSKYICVFSVKEIRVMVQLTIVRKMCESVNHSLILRTVFSKCVESVKPKSLLTKKIELVSPNAIRIGHEFVDIDNRKLHLVGFGKAVLGMAVQMERLLGDRLVCGMLSVPVGTNERFSSDPDMQLHENSVIRVFEGAKNNLPDSNAESTAKRIVEYVNELTERDVLFVLISGGGSALLPIPAPPIALSEKCDVIKMLASRGATINELNTVRIRMSSVKGGKLAVAARNAHRIISLVISDICGDPINLIASGPTTIQRIEDGEAKNILQKYDLLQSMPQSVLSCVERSCTDEDNHSLNNSVVQIIGNNSIAIDVATEEMDKQNVRAICMSKRIEGNVAELSSIYCRLAEAIHELDSGQLTGEEFKKFINSFDETLMLEEDFCGQLTNAVQNKANRNPICLISGGETTVTIKGNGVGGRNQELALRIAREIEKRPLIRNVTFLSAGTDGIDGPCDAAGAIGSLQMVKDSNKIKPGMIETYIQNNDSYSLYKSVSDGKYQIITGHTGTNVMDLHFMIIPLS